MWNMNALSERRKEAFNVKADVTYGNHCGVKAKRKVWKQIDSWNKWTKETEIPTRWNEIAKQKLVYVISSLQSSVT
jgi:hypothetical protein